MLAILKEFNNQKGRFNRYKFWVHTLIMNLLIFVLLLILMGLSFVVGDGGFAIFLAKLGGLLIPIMYLYIVFTAYIKRLHDLEKSGWMSLLIIVPLANIYLFVICGFFKGTVGSNQYGEDPLGNTNTQSNTTTDKKEETKGDNTVEL